MTKSGEFYKTETVQKMLVTPSIAAVWLKHNYEGQRRLSKATVDEYARAMTSGEWNEDVPGIICVGDNGKIIDGQHRLAAVVQSGKSIWFEVRNNIPVSAFAYFDQGKRRLTADYIDSKSSKVIVSVIGRAIAVEKRGISFSSAATHPVTARIVLRQEIIDEYNSNPEKWERINKLGACLYRELNGCATKSGLGCVAWAMEQIGEFDELEQFASELTECTATPAATRLTKWISQILAEKATGKRRSEALVIGTFLQAFDAYKSGTNPKSLNKGLLYLEKYDKIMHQTMEGLFNDSNKA